MPTVSATAYPQLPITVTERELREVYTPTQEQRDLARQHTAGQVAEVALLVLLKVFQRLGYRLASHWQTGDGGCGCRRIRERDLVRRGKCTVFVAQDELRYS